MTKNFGQKNGMWKKSQTDSAKAAISESRKNKRWIYDPLLKVQKSVDVGEVDRYLSQGWKLGRLRYKKGPDFLFSF